MVLEPLLSLAAVGVQSRPFLGMRLLARNGERRTVAVFYSCLDTDVVRIKNRPFDQAESSAITQRFQRKLTKM